MSIIPVSVGAKILAQTISSTDMSFKLNNIQSWSGADLTPADFGTEAYGVFTNSSRTKIEIFKFDPATIANASITILTRGLGYSGGDVEVPANKFAWTSNDTVVQMGTDAPQLFRDFMSSSNPATVTAQHEYDLLPESAVAPTDDEDFVNKAYVDAKTGSALAVPVNQVAHGFVEGDVIRASGTNTYTKAQADSAVNAEVVGIVNTVAGVDDFTYTTEGAVTAGVPAEAAGTVLFLSPTVAGALTATEPITMGHVSLPLAIITESGVSMVFHKFRGAVLSTIAGNPIASETTAGVVEQATPAEVAAGTDVGTTGAPLFVVPSLIPEAPSIDVQEFTASGTWTKPSGGTRVLVQAWGGGGAGGRGASLAGGGGGGAYVEAWFDIDDLGATETVTIGAGGVGTSGDGGAGGDTTFGSLLTAYAGGGGAGDNVEGGGGGGGSLSAGASTTTANGGLGGRPIAGVAGTSSNHGGDSAFGGGGGGAESSRAGGWSHMGGGGGGGYVVAGGKSVYGGGGGGGGGGGIAGTSIYGGDGGVGSTGAGGAGSVPGGGGGGGRSGAGGAGGAGKVIVTVF